MLVCVVQLVGSRTDYRSDSLIFMACKNYILYIVSDHSTIVFLSQNIILVLENSVEPDEMLHYWGLNCLPNYAFRRHKYTNI